MEDTPCKNYHTRRASTGHETTSLRVWTRGQKMNNGSLPKRSSSDPRAQHHSHLRFADRDSKGDVLGLVVGRVPDCLPLSPLLPGSCRDRGFLRGVYSESEGTYEDHVPTGRDLRNNLIRHYLGIWYTILE